MNDKPTVPYISIERVISAFELTIKRLWVTIMVLIVLLFASNLAWVCFLNGYDFENYEYQQGDNGINIIGDDNKEVTYNGSEIESAQADPKKRSER